jgi:integrase
MMQDGDEEDAIPEIVRAAGKRAVTAYREFVDDEKWSPTTRRLYAARAQRFFEWAQGRCLTLKCITAADIAAYGPEVGPTRATAHLTPVRAVFERLVGVGLRADNPCRVRMPNDRRSFRWEKEKGKGDIAIYCQPEKGTLLYINNQ